MSKRITARGIIIDNDYTYLIFRRKNNKEYYVVPGGGAINNETLEDTLKRELKEELSVDIKVNKYIGLTENKDTISHYYACTITFGTPILGGEEAQKCSQENYYEIRKININELDKLNIIGKDMIIKAFDISH